MTLVQIPYASGEQLQNVETPPGGRQHRHHHLPDARFSASDMILSIFELLPKYEHN